MSQMTGQPLDCEAPLRRGSDGVYRWFLIRAVPVRNKRGKIAKWCGAATDIEDRKRAEKLKADLTRASRVSTIGELVASISHELAQPITVTTARAKASLRWLQHDPPNVAEARRGTEKIMEAGTLAADIINHLRSLYTKAPPKRELVAINEVVVEMAGMMGGKARENGVSIRTDLHSAQIGASGNWKRASTTVENNKIGSINTASHIELRRSVSYSARKASTGFTRAARRAGR